MDVHMSQGVGMCRSEDAANSPTARMRCLQSPTFCNDSFAPAENYVFRLTLTPQ